MLPHMADYEDAHKALKIVSDATDHVNKLMNQGDNFKKLVELIQSFNEGNIDIHPGQILIKEGVVQEQTRDGLEPRHLILLNDQLIVGKYCDKIELETKTFGLVTIIQNLGTLGVPNRRLSLRSMQLGNFFTEQ